MDDPWSNAWGSPEDPKDEVKITTRNDDLQEDDLSMPSWSTGPGIRWNEPSESDALSPLWSNTHTKQDWSLENPYGDIPLGFSRSSELSNDSSPVLTLLAQPQNENVQAPPPSEEPDEEVSSSQSHSSAPSPVPSPSSPDAFGTFTAGTEQTDVAPSTVTGTLFESQLDGSEWDAPWEMYGPPELLSRILLHLEELSKDAWPETQDVAESDWQKRWHSGMDIDGFDSLLLRYIPTLTLPPNLPFGKSFTAKAMANAIKLSRNTALTRVSPMSAFLAAKGSTAWETSVKSRIETHADEVPLGWRILEKDPKNDERIEEKAKKSTGLLAGLWGRRTSGTPSYIPGPEQSNTPLSSTALENVHSAPTPSQRSSVESQKSPSRTNPVAPALFDLSPSPAPVLSQDEDAPVLSAPSAVSRFFNRFSRSRMSASPRNSLALSSDDLEYLSDVMSSSADQVDKIDEPSMAFADVTASQSLHGKLPPPLPPPPLPPPNTTARASSGLRGPVRGDTMNTHTLTLPSNLDVNGLFDGQEPTEQSIITSLLTPVPSSIQIKDSLKPINMGQALSHSSPPDRIKPFLIAPILPASPSQSSTTMSSPSVTRPQSRLTPGHTIQTTDISQDDDDFSDFRSSPADPPLLPLNANSSFIQSQLPSSHLSHNQLNSSFGDLVNLMSPPTKGLSDIFKQPDAASPPSLTSFALPIVPARPSSTIAERRTLTHPGLMERAAARPGRWPAPPSPLPDVLIPPPPAESTPSYSASLNLLDDASPDSRPNNQRSTSPPKLMSTFPQRKAVTQVHQRTQSLLDLAASRPGRWPAPPSPSPEARLPPPPTTRGQSEVSPIVDFFGSKPIDGSFPSPLSSLPSGNTSPLPSFSKTTSPQVTSLKRDWSLPTGITNANSQSSSGSPSLTAPAPPGQSAQRTLSPPLPAAIMSKSPPKPSSAPVPLLPPPSGYRLTPPLNPSPQQYSPESTPLALLIDNDEKNTSLPVVRATLPPPAKGSGGLSAQDLSFFEGL
ncbi:hypothetical protein B0F90DRAFT_1694367 [Multifurca ochricompacta]|uniref:Uncharacterized protein n=1 Tax=Multifurca ochricompacta TaxID=376703 RepID=A0AAD4M967_9AGAM|nr:hypothetical protein B0F90DRAFT_1694367 [Multifurca ochricompacta]